MLGETAELYDKLGVTIGIGNKSVIVALLASRVH